MESAGAQVIPLIHGESEEVTKDKLSKINGVLYPGGGGDYMAMGQMIHDEIVAQNDNGTFYPEWGTCLGFERLALFTASNPDDTLTRIGAHKLSMPLNFTVDPLETKMYCGMNDHQLDDFKHGNFTLNSHSWSITPETMKSDEGLASFWNVTSHTSNEAGDVWVASMEAKDYPIMATQFHPEKPSQVFNGEGINHSWESLQLNHLFADKFVEMARANKNKFADFDERAQYLISNHELLQTTYYPEGMYVFE
uniref:folate gamma-glutamyl hydrolase n=1 Tax=Strombidium inclinatum TaxID=197538 RepID=A0A7S3IWN7_9SPIT|mmetsp:Transcript_42671/g.65456  ORF Transcript_42671/g.65456 Transcript_42671/m.65456 type:complete len:251 (+) Transcript_42671:242-994(+)|eukprot:CAMPEP_0170494460 /NCGR_PEP_ID=MMETSP0208-20121228/14655_1 /TAXON_ID=197538 /ORGANISM="Strombidium inclinatum, Strain S3" /LENGTH=250 /DNA_ID=CAMNT_0010770521 /DNA_START=242 /DNA_END=994 /DNA_ORIENTATION=+